MEKAPNKIQLRRSCISTGEAIQNTKDSLSVVSRFQGARAGEPSDDVPRSPYPTSEFRINRARHMTRAPEEPYGATGMAWAALAGAPGYSGRAREICRRRLAQMKLSARCGPSGCAPPKCRGCGAPGSESA